MLFVLSSLPSLWKRANISPVHMSGDKEQVTNYRSISLLSIPAKCLERIVYSPSYDHVAPSLSDWQHGFIKGRSCVTQLVLTYHQWVKCLVGRPMLCFSISLKRLIEYLMTFYFRNYLILAFSGFLLNWCANCFSDLYQRIVIDD